LIDVCHRGPPGAIGEKFTVSQHGHEDVSHEQRPLHMEKRACMVISPIRWALLLRFPTYEG
jgi:hypothetical protein